MTLVTAASDAKYNSRAINKLIVIGLKTLRHMRESTRSRMGCTLIIVVTFHYAEIGMRGNALKAHTTTGAPKIPTNSPIT